jgi:hypothetical protein
MRTQEGATADADALLGEYYTNDLLGHVFTWSAQATGRVGTIDGGKLRVYSALLSGAERRTERLEDENAPLSHRIKSDDAVLHISNVHRQPNLPGGQKMDAHDGTFVAGKCFDGTPVTSHRIERLTPDYTASTGDFAEGGPCEEAHAGFKRKGVYYALCTNYCGFCSDGSSTFVDIATAPPGPWRRQGGGGHSARPTALNRLVAGDIACWYNASSPRPSADGCIEGCAPFHGVSIPRAQLNDITQIGDTQFVWGGDRWQQAADGLKSHDLQSLLPMEFDSRCDSTNDSGSSFMSTLKLQDRNRTIECIKPLRWVDNFTLAPIRTKKTDDEDDSIAQMPPLLLRKDHKKDPPGSNRSPPPRQSKIDHFVVLLMENHAFDNVYGCLDKPGVDGIFKGHAVRKDPADPSQGWINITCGTGPNICSAAPHFDIFAGKFPKVGSNSGIYPYSEQSDRYSGESLWDGRNTSTTAVHMFGMQQAPVKAAIAEHFGIFNKLYSAVPSASIPNHLFVQSATSCGVPANGGDSSYLQCGGKTRRVPGVDGLPAAVYPQPTIYDNLQEHGISFGLFLNSTCGLDGMPCTGRGMAEVNVPDILMAGVARHKDRFFSQKNFYDRAANGSLPAFAWILPPYEASDHPCNDMRKGERYLKDVYEALRSGPKWENTMLFVGYDDAGGYYDHVVPPHEGVPADGAPCNLVGAPDYQCA